jgi:hypothetical protein
VSSTRWRGYSSDEIAALSDWEIFSPPLSEHRCPHCGKTSLRIYMYTSRVTGDLSTQIWCYNCHSYSGWTGPQPDDVTVLDPLTELSDEEFDAINKDEGTLFGYLDRLWERGTLPQRIIRR